MAICNDPAHTTLLEENARLRNERVQLRRKVKAWDHIHEEARTANIYSHLEPDELQRVVDAAWRAAREG